MKKGTSSDDKLLQRAKKRVWVKRSLLWHLVSYVGVNILLLAIYYLTTPGGCFWPVWSLACWGFGFIVHAIVVASILSRDGSPDEVTREYERLKREEAQEDE